MSVDVAMQSSGKTVATSAYSIMQPLGGRQDPGSSCQDDPFNAWWSFPERPPQESGWGGH